MNEQDPHYAADTIDAIAADVFSDSETAEQFAANDLAAMLNQALRIAGRPEATPATVLRFARTVELGSGPDIEVDPRDMRPFGEVFGDAPDGEP